MKASYKNIMLLFIALAMPGLFVSCSDDELPNNGKPMISYVRVNAPEASDSLITSAGQGSMVTIVGENLQGARELWFNDRQASLVPTYITNTTIVTRIPSRIPMEINNEMKIIFSNGDSLSYAFVVAINKPVITRMEREYAPAGDTTTIRGNYFYKPLAVSFSGGVVAEIISVEDEVIEVVVPEGAERGPITITSNFGKTESKFWYLDNRNVILNYDDLTAAGSWRSGPIATENGLDGNYLKLYGALNANQRVEDNFTSQFWGHTRYPEERNLVEGDPKNYVLKFEARIVNWYGSYLNICWGPWSNDGNGEVWGNLNGRGIWAPWEVKNTNFSTNGKWITVSIPISEMKYRHEQDGGDNVWIPDIEFDPKVSGTLSFWLIATPEADGSPVEINIDNVRIVEK